MVRAPQVNENPRRANGRREEGNRQPVEHPVNVAAHKIALDLNKRRTTAFRQRCGAIRWLPEVSGRQADNGAGIVKTDDKRVKLPYLRIWLMRFRNRQASVDFMDAGSAGVSPATQEARIGRCQTTLLVRPESAETPRPPKPSQRRPTVRGNACGAIEKFAKGQIARLQSRAYARCALHPSPLP